MNKDNFVDDIKECMEAGMNAHIAKPIDTNALKEELTSLSL